MFDLRKSAEALFEYLEENQDKSFSDLPKEHLEVWFYLKTGNRLEMYLKEARDKEAEVIPLKRKPRQASP